MNAWAIAGCSLVAFDIGFVATLTVAPLIRRAAQRRHLERLYRRPAAMPLHERTRP